MTKKETIKVLQSIEDRAIDFPNMTECDWVAIAAAKRHLTEEPVNEELEEAAVEAFKQIVDSDKNNFLEIFKAGAKWKKQQLMAKAIDAKCFGFQGDALFSFKLPADKYLVGSKVKVIVIKED